VLRNYYDPRLEAWWPAGGKVLVLPLGYASGFLRHGPAARDETDTCESGDGNGDVSVSNSVSSTPPGKRDLDFAFVGNGGKGSRPAMLAALVAGAAGRSSSGGFAVRSSGGFLGRGSIGSGAGAAPLLRAAVFCPCPCGYEHPDSFRCATSEGEMYVLRAPYYLLRTVLTAARLFRSPHQHHHLIARLLLAARVQLR